MLSDVEIDYAVRYLGNELNPRFFFFGVWPVHRESFDVLLDRHFHAFEAHSGRVYERKTDYSSSSSSDEDDDDDDGKRTTPQRKKSTNKHCLADDKEPIQYAFVLNTSVKGEHWVAVLVERHQSHISIEFFDSFGLPPGSYGNLMELCMQTLISQTTILSENAVPVQPVYYDRRIQAGNVECGMFCIWFLLQRMRGKSFKSIIDARVEDKTMTELRRQMRLKGYLL